MEELFVEFAKATIALFVIVDPLGNIPIFLGLTRRLDKESRGKVFKIATLTAFFLLLFFALAGREVMYLFGISLPNFKLAGGTLLLVISIKILVYGEWEEKVTDERTTGVVPLGFPLLAGPGAITATIVNLQSYGMMVTLLATSLVFLLTWLILRFIDAIYKILGELGSAVIARLMAVFIAAIAFQFIVEGIQHQFM
jgi:multiple antibiotic resistance protein